MFHLAISVSVIVDYITDCLVRSLESPFYIILLQHICVVVFQVVFHVTSNYVVNIFSQVKVLHASSENILIPLSNSAFLCSGFEHRMTEKCVGAPTH